MVSELKRAALPVGIGLMGVAAYILLQITAPQPAPRLEAPRPISVKVEPAIRTLTRPTIVAFGEVRPAVRTELVAQVGGKVVATSAAFIEGGNFTPDDVLLSIEDTDYRAAMEEVVARVAAAKLELEQALADADVARKQLAAQSNPSPLALREPQVARAESALRAAQTSLSLAKTNLERTQISLPYTGRVENKFVDLGQYVNPGKVLGTVFGTDVVQVRLPLTTNQLAALAVPIGYQGTADGGLSTTLTATLGGAVHRWHGTLTGLDAAIDPTTRTVYGTVIIEDPYSETSSVVDMPLAVGLYVDAEVEGRLMVDAVQIPSAGLRAGDKIFVLTGEGLLDIRQADVVHRSRSNALLSAGVEPGEQVIVSAIRNPVRGMRLQTIDGAVIADSVITEPANNDNEA
jgi:RND family efflux transporter MFP subunit